MNQLVFLPVAATGDWKMACVVAPEWPSVVWDERTLRDFVRLLAPGDDRDEREIAAEYASWAESISMEHCFRVAEEWLWLALRAQGDWAAAVEYAKVALQWPECNGRDLENLLCHIAQRTDDDGQQAAKDIYRWVLFGSFTRDQLAEYRGQLLPQIVPTAQQYKIDRQAGPIRQTVIEERLPQPKRAVAGDEAARDRRRMAKRVIDPVQARARKQVVDDLKPALQGSSRRSIPQNDAAGEEHNRIGNAYLKNTQKGKEGADLNIPSTEGSATTSAERRVAAGGLHGEALKEWFGKASAANDASESILKRARVGTPHYFAFHPGSGLALIGESNPHYSDWKDQFTGKNVHMLVEGSITVTKRGYNGQVRVDLNESYDDVGKVAEIVRRYTDKTPTIGSRHSSF